MNDSDINTKELEEQIAKSLGEMSSDEIREVFIEGMIFEKFGGDEGLDADVVKELKTDLNDRLDAKVNDKIVNALSPEDVKSLDELIDGGASGGEINEALSQKGVKVDELVTAAMQELRDEYLGEEAKSEEE